MQQNHYHSYNTGQLPQGCQMCVCGEKLVLFVTGVCPRKCYFCPVSDDKWGKDVIFANERAVHTDQDVLDEARAMDAKGAGVTGGDPLTRLDRTVNYIKLLKKEFGKQFHVHLYTSLNLVTQNVLEQLHNAGLDEIRFHLDLDSKEHWTRLTLARKFSWDVGVEIPLIPHKENETQQLIAYVLPHIDFLNLNELEVADNELSKLTAMGMKVKNQLSYAVRGSLELGLDMLKKCTSQDVPVHVCTAKLKDGVQLTNRIKREGEHSKRSIDIVDEEGLLHRAALYLPVLAPGVGYRKKLKACDQKTVLAQLQRLRKLLCDECDLNDDELVLDTYKLRLLTSTSIAKQCVASFTKAGLKTALVTEYPTADQIEVEVEFLS